MIITHQTIFVLGLPVNHPHILDPDKQTGNKCITLPAERAALPGSGSEVSPGLDDIDGHRRCRGNQTTDHTGTEMTEDVIVEIS